jgi:transposase, IS6 family
MQGNKSPSKGRQFTAAIILWAVRRHLQFPISYRDLERMLEDRGITVDHTTLFRWLCCTDRLVNALSPPPLPVV